MHGVYTYDDWALLDNMGGLLQYVGVAFSQAQVKWDAIVHHQLQSSF